MKCPKAQVGQRHGCWTLLNPVEGNRLKWEARCESCGRTYTRLVYAITSGHSTRCGNCAQERRDQHTREVFLQDQARWMFLTRRRKSAEE